MCRFVSKVACITYGILTGIHLPTAGYGSSIAQDSLPPILASTKTTPNFQTYQPIAEATRILKSTAPRIDGDLSDPAWQQAKVIDTFYQVDPEEGIAPTEPTRAYILYDEDNLYVGVYAYTSDTNTITASQMRRDPALNQDDGIRIVLDPFNTTRDGFFFGMNPNGARLDALTENNSRFIGSWNTLWEGDAKITDNGWTAEFAIPFRSLSYDASAEHWGLQIVRTLRQKNESIRWSNIDRTRNRTDLTQSGLLTGLKDINQGKGLEAQVFGTFLYSQAEDIPGDQLGDEDISFRPSANLKYKFTPSLTGTLTLNTDFSDTPLDSRQVNTGRFSLFFPETRDFFLQDAAVFEFGGRNFRRPNGLPFFSRRIGIVGGLPADIIAGGKVSGKFGNVSIGGLVTHTDETSNFDLSDNETTSFDAQTLSAFRVSVPVLADSKVGFILTHGDPTGETDNTVAGVDFQYKNTALKDGFTLQADFTAIQSTTEINDTTIDPSDISNLGTGNLLSADVAWFSDEWSFDARIREMEDDYGPRLGFVNRNDIREAVISGRRSFRPENSPIRRINFGGFTGYRTDTDDNALDQFTGIFTSGRFQTGGRFFAEVEQIRTIITDGFDIADAVYVPSGTYEYTALRGEISTDRSRPISVELSGQISDIYNGTELRLSPELTWRPNKYFELDLNYRYTTFDNPAQIADIDDDGVDDLLSGDLDIHIASIETAINITPDMNVSTEIQYDNISEGFSFFGRYNWERRPGQTITLSLGHSADLEADDFPGDYTARGTSLSLRLGHTARF